METNHPMASFAPNSTGSIKLDTQIKMQGEKTTKTRPIVIQLPSTFETIRDEILSHHNSGTLSKEQKNAHFIFFLTIL